MGQYIVSDRSREARGVGRVAHEIILDDKSLIHDSFLLDYASYGECPGQAEFSLNLSLS